MQLDPVGMLSNSSLVLIATFGAAQRQLDALAEVKRRKLELSARPERNAEMFAELTGKALAELRLQAAA